MHRRTVMKLFFVFFTLFLSLAGYHTYMSLDSLGRAALVESGDTTYYAPLDRLSVAMWSVSISAFIAAVMITATMLMFYVLMYFSTYRGVEHAKTICKDMGCDDPTIYKDVHWYGYEWLVSGKLPDGDTFVSTDKDGLFEGFELVYN